MPHPGLDEARQRLRRWLTETDVDPRSPEQRKADADREYGLYFAPEANPADRAKGRAEQAERIAAVARDTTARAAHARRQNAPGYRRR